MESRGRRVTSIRPRALQSQFRWLTSEHQENAARSVGTARLFLAAKGERPFSHFLSYPPMRFPANVYRRPPDTRTEGHPGCTVVGSQGGFKPRPYWSPNVTNGHC